MPFANEDIRFGYDLVYGNVTNIGGNPDATDDDKTFRDAVVDLIRWRKGEIGFPFEDAPAMEPTGASLRDWTRAEIIDRIIGYCDAAGIPRRLGLGCGIAESGLRQYAERNGDWPDVSFGIGQQIVLYAPVGDGTGKPENIATVRTWLFDPENAISLMVQKLALNYSDAANPGVDVDGRVLYALFKYNVGSYMAPAGRFASNVANYERGLAAADVILEGIAY